MSTKNFSGLPGPLNDGLIHGFRVLCYAPWLPAGGGLRGPRTVVLVDRGPGYEGRERYVTAAYVAGDHEWMSGHYLQTYPAALADFSERVSAHGLLIY